MKSRKIVFALGAAALSLCIPQAVANPIALPFPSYDSTPINPPTVTSIGKQDALEQSAERLVESLAALKTLVDKLPRDDSHTAFIYRADKCYGFDTVDSLLRLDAFYYCTDDWYLLENEIVSGSELRSALTSMSYRHRRISKKMKKNPPLIVYCFKIGTQRMK